MNECLGPKQEEVILHFVSVNDVFVSLLTGSGKFFSYSLLLGVFDKVHQLHSLSFVLVVSPLAALMREREVRQKTLSEFPSAERGYDVTYNSIPQYHEYVESHQTFLSPLRVIKCLVCETTCHPDALGICCKQQWKLPLHHIIILQEQLCIRLLLKCGLLQTH